MAVPGLQMSEVNEAVTEKVHEIAAGAEWRFEVAHGSSIDVKILRGSGEIFGTELPLGHKFTFTGTKAAIYTWYGCSIEVIGVPTVEYTAEETPMTQYANTHFALEKQRGLAAASANRQGPRVMVVGPEDAGKTSLIKLLAGYAIRQGRAPCVVNLDPKEGMLSLPGTLTAASFSTIMDVEEGWGTAPTSGPSLVPPKSPLVYYYGLENPETSEKLYKKLVSRMALAVTSRLSEDGESRVSGCLIDTSGSMAQASGYDLIQHVAAEFSVDTLLVLGSERLYSDMVRRFAERQQNSLAVIKLPKSGGVVDREESFLKQCRERAVREYFFGGPKLTLSPYTVTELYDSVNIRRVAVANLISASLLPAGMEQHQPLLTKAQPGPDLQHCVLAVIQAELGDSEEIMAESPVLGFVYVSSVDDQKQHLRILSPVSGRLPPKPLLVSNFPEPAFSLM